MWISLILILIFLTFNFILFYHSSGLVKGLNQVGKALDRKDAYLCILAEDCDDPKYKKLITALAKQNKIPLIEVDSRNELGEWLGQCKYDKAGVARKVRGASSVAIKDYGENSEALTFLEQYVKEHDLWAHWSLSFKLWYLKAMSDHRERTEPLFSWTNASDQLVHFFN